MAKRGVPLYMNTFSNTLSQRNPDILSKRHRSQSSGRVVERDLRVSAARCKRCMFERMSNVFTKGVSDDCPKASLLYWEPPSWPREVRPPISTARRARLQHTLVSSLPHAHMGVFLLSNWSHVLDAWLGTGKEFWRCLGPFGGLTTSKSSPA